MFVFRVLAIGKCHLRLGTNTHPHPLYTLVRLDQTLTQHIIQQITAQQINQQNQQTRQQNTENGPRRGDKTKPEREWSAIYKTGGGVSVFVCLYHR